MKVDPYSLKRLPIVLTIIAAIVAVVFLIFNGASAAAQNTPQEIQGYQNSQASDNAAVTLHNVQVHPSDVQVELCIEMPTLDPWNPYATLTIDGTVIPNTEVALVNAKDPTVMKSRDRCYLFTFPVSAADSASQIGTLKLEKLSLEVQGGLLTDSGAAAARARLQADQPQLDFKVVVKSGNGGSGAYIQLLSKPEGMSDAQAIQLIQQASIDEVPGNWQTEINLK